VAFIYQLSLKLDFSPPALKLPSPDMATLIVVSDSWLRLRVSS
jgi:hypothetical protein